MKAKELRIGNYIEMDNEGYSEVIKIGVDYVDVVYPDGEVIKNKDTYFENYKPIPLTEEWLLKLGFKKEDFTYDKDRLSIHLKSRNYPTGRTYFNSWCIIEKQIEHVNQLQNLYFALIGEELILKSI